VDTVSDLPTTWLTTEDLARRYQVPVATVRTWRHKGTGPDGVVFGRHVRYSVSEVERWERERAERAIP
jgi:DNA-binding transcriptional regulator YiaG